jgi:ABC-type uncharacterized transport system involved in gliding motility auxiliary subunit
VAGLLAFLSTRYEVSFDWTAAKRHTLSAASVAVLDAMKDPITVTAFAREGTPEDKAIRDRISFLVDRYRRVKHDIHLEFVNPDRAPDQVRNLGIRLNGELVVSYQGRDQHVEQHTEQAMTNALQSLARATQRWVVYLKGHGERDLLGQANRDLGTFGDQLRKRGFKVQPLELARTGAIPDNTSVLVVAGPQVDLLPAEVNAVIDYVKRGGNLLLMLDPGEIHGLQPLLQQLGVSFEPGTIVDPTTQRLGIQEPTMALVLHYPDFPATAHFDYVTLFPLAAGLKVEAPKGYKAAKILNTSDSAWSETGALEGSVSFDAGKDIKGPLTIGVALTHAGPKGKAAHQQRIIVTGDGDFLANNYLGNSGNLDLGLRLMTWLSGDDSLIQIPARVAADQTLQLSAFATGAIGIGFLFALPLGLLAIGGGIWLKRRQR